MCFIKLRYPPTSTHYSFVLNESLKYPAVTICRNPPFKTDIFQKYGFLNDEITYATTWKTFKYDKFTIQEFFNEVTYNLSEMFSIVALDKFKKNLKISSTFTLTYGQCFTMSPEIESKKWGNKYGYYFYLAPKTNVSSTPQKGFHVFIHEEREIFSEKISEDLFQEYIYIETGDSIQVNLKINNYNQLPSNSNKCNSSFIYSKSMCMENNANTKISTYARCQTPWIPNKSLPDCNNYKQLQDIVTNSTSSLYLQNILQNTHCVRNCRTTLYLPLVQSIREIDHTEWSLKIYYSSNLIAQMEEVVGYDFNNFVSDLGGSLGFLLGLSVLGAVGLIENVISSTMKKTSLSKKLQQDVCSINGNSLKDTSGFDS
ncbi:hypothetical protein FQR65_LT06434 [Abscondita terminalis]|nr:hypothetical protein FQR65_LT06434 [Abscondita terminalis]